MKERVDPIINRPSLIYLKSMHLLSDPSTREELITIVPKRDTTIITTRKGLSSITEFALRDNRGWMTTYSQYLSISNWSIQMQSTIGIASKGIEYFSDKRRSGTMGEKNIYQEESSPVAHQTSLCSRHCSHYNDTCTRTNCILWNKRAKLSLT